MTQLCGVARLTRINRPERSSMPSMLAWISCAIGSNNCCEQTMIPAWAELARCNLQKSSRFCVTTARPWEIANRRASSSGIRWLELPASCDVNASWPNVRSRLTTGSGKFSLAYWRAIMRLHSRRFDFRFRRGGFSRRPMHSQGLRRATMDRRRESPPR